MADNTVLNSGTGGDTIATDDIGGIKHQRVKIEYGADGVANEVSSASPLPVDLRADNLAGNLDVNIAASGITVPVDVSDDATRDLGKVDIAAFDQYTPIDVDSGAPVVNALPVVLRAVKAGGGNLGDATDPIRVNPTGTTAQPVTDNGGSLTVDGTVIVQDGAGSLTVDSAQLPAALVSGRLDVNVGNTPTVNIGTFPDNEPFNLAQYAGSAAGASNAVHVRPGTAAVFPVSDNASTLSVDDGGGVLTVDGTVTAAQATAANLKAQVQLIDSAGDSAMDDTTNSVRVNVVAGAAADGAVVDGLVPSVRASVLNYTNARPLAVRLTDLNGDYVTATGGTQYAEDSPSTQGELLTMAGVVRKNTPTALVDTDGDRTSLQVDSTGALYVNLVNGAYPGADEDAQFADGEKLVMVGAVRRDTPVSGASAAGDRATINVDANGRLYTAAEVTGNVAHDNPDAGSPIKLGAVAQTSAPTAVTAGDRVNLAATKCGQLLTQPFALPAEMLSGVNASAMTDTTATQIIAAQGAGSRIYVTSLIVANSSTTVDTLVSIRSGSTTIKLMTPAARDCGGAVVPLPTPLRLGDNEGLYAACVTTGANVFVSAVGYKSTE